MYTIDKAVIDAIRSVLFDNAVECHSRCVGNVVAKKNLGILDVELHGNRIFTYFIGSKHFEWSDCGWPTKTTTNRINDCLIAINSKVRVVRHFKRDANGKMIDRRIAEYVN